MSAMVCGNKRTLFEDQTDHPTSVSSPVPKRFRRCSPSSSSSSPIGLPAPTSGPVDRLLALFPQIEPQVSLLNLNLPEGYNVSYWSCSQVFGVIDD